MNAQQEAGAIIAHYLRQLTQASGRRWTPANDHDMQRLGALLADDQAETIAPYYQQAAPELPAEPHQIGSAVTQVLERREPAHADGLDDPSYQRWRVQRQQDEQARRMLQREASRR
jgi:hypothetical protein